MAVPYILHKIISDPSFGLKPKELAGPTGDEESPLDMSLFTEGDFSMCKAKIENYHPNKERALDWIEKLRAGDWDALVALILVLLPNLEEIEFEAWPMCMWLHVLA